MQAFPVCFSFKDRCSKGLGISKAETETETETDFDWRHI